MYGDIKFILWRREILFFSIFSPLIKTSPLLGFNNPKIIPIVVVFPHPLGPNKPTISFSLILKFILATASLSLYFFDRLITSIEFVINIWRLSLICR